MLWLEIDKMEELENRKGKPKISVIDKMFAYVFLPFIPKWVRPNAITTFRLVCIPIVIYLFLSESYLWGTIVFTVAAVSDALDGAMARVRHQITGEGKFFDPLADKLLIGSAAFILISKYISWQLALLIILIELVIILIALYKKRTLKNVKIQAKPSGKIKMILQCAGVILLLLYILSGAPMLLLISEIVLWFAIVFAIISMFAYNSI